MDNGIGDGTVTNIIKDGWIKQKNDKFKIVITMTRMAMEDEDEVMEICRML
jgi:hypothetical protein